MNPGNNPLLESFFSPKAPIRLHPWNGKPSEPGLYFLDRDPPSLLDIRGQFSRVEAGVIRIEFNPSRSVAEIVLERGFQRGRPLHSFFPARADVIPPWLREILLRASVAPRLRKDCFPRWPIESCIEDIRIMVREAAGETGAPAAVEAFWPAGRRFAVVLSHDMDSVDVYRDGTWREFADIEEALGMRSSWHFCSDHIREAEPVLEELSRRGHEIAWHGPRHDYRIAFQPPDRIRAVIERDSALLSRMNVCGFRSPFYLRTDRLYNGLSAKFSYDSSCRDTAAEFLSPHTREGCCTVFPYFRKGTMVLPVTVPEDYTIRFLVGDDAEQIHAIQKAKTDWIRSVGGMAMILTHPVRWLSCTPGGLGAYRRILESLSRDPEAYMALARDVAEWWRNRAGAVYPAAD